MTGWKKFGAYGSEKAAKAAGNRESRRTGHAYEFKLVKKHVGRSVDPAYSDKDGYQWELHYMYVGGSR